MFHQRLISKDDHDIICNEHFDYMFSSTHKSGAIFVFLYLFHFSQRELLFTAHFTFKTELQDLIFVIRIWFDCKKWALVSKQSQNEYKFAIWHWLPGQPKWRQRKRLLQRKSRLIKFWLIMMKAFFFPLWNNVCYESFIIRLEICFLRRNSFWIYIDFQIFPGVAMGHNYHF